MVLEARQHQTPRQKALGVDEGLPSLQHVEDEEKVCSVCKRYVFVSKADKGRHLLLIHDQRSAKRKADQGVHISRVRERICHTLPIDPPQERHWAQVPERQKALTQVRVGVKSQGIIPVDWSVLHEHTMWFTL